MEGEINSNKSTNPAKDVAALNAPSCKNHSDTSITTPISTHPYPPTFTHPSHSSSYIAIHLHIHPHPTHHRHHHKSLFIQFNSSVGITHYTLVSLFLLHLLVCFFMCVLAGRGGSVRLRQMGIC